MDSVKTTEASLFEDLGHMLVLRAFVKDPSTLCIAHLMAQYYLITLFVLKLFVNIMAKKGEKR